MKTIVTRIIAAVAAAMLMGSAVLADELWIDVRSAKEHRADAIAGDPNIEYTQIAEGIEALAPDRNTEIALYCGSGGRSGVARLRLLAMGYTKVRNAGGIADARSERGLH